MLLRLGDCILGAALRYHMQCLDAYAWNQGFDLVKMIDADEADEVRNTVSQ